MKLSRALLVLAVIVAIALWWLFDLGRYLSFEQLQAQRGALLDWKDARPLHAAAIFFAAYVAVTALSFPGAAVLTLAAGAIFGLGWGTLLASLASTLGATLAMLVARHLAGDAVQRRYGPRLRALNEGMARDGAFYLFTLRLVPLFPFFVVNLLMGLTRIRVRTYVWVSQLGMLPGTLVYVNAGTQLGELSSASGILSADLLGAFVLMGLFPLVARRLVEQVRGRRIYARWQRPRRFDRNLIVIGAGSAGLVTAYIAAAVKARVTLIEKDRMGGDCLNTGCVPSKALIRSARLMHELRRAGEFGIAGASGEADFARVMARVREMIARIAPHDSVERYTALGVECLHGEAHLVDPWTVEVDGRRLTARDIVIATGAAPFVPPIEGLQAEDYVTSESVWDLRERPRRLIVLGGGPIGCELAQAFARLGSEVTVVQSPERLLPREDAEFGAALAQRFAGERITVHLNTRGRAVRARDGERVLVCDSEAGTLELPFDRILIAAGRRARLSGFGLEALGVRCDKTIETNALLQTSVPNIWACGDVAGPYQFTHTASHMAWYAAVNSLFGPLLALRGGRFAVDWRVIPWVTFTDPEIARVGLSEEEARAQGIACEVTRYGLDDLDRAIVDGAAHGEVKVLTVPGKDRILGVTIIGEHAGELIAEYVLAMRHRIGLNKILGTIHVYPTLSEANKYAAGRWKQAHAPQRLLRIARRWHDWRRG